MKIAHSKKIIGAGILALSLATLPATLPAAAQNNSTVQNNSNRPALDTTPFQETKDDFNNFGWLGALGLIGLANLFRKPKRRTTYVDTPTDSAADPTVVDRTNYRP